jgi:hypothetical protein
MLLIPCTLATNLPGTQPSQHGGVGETYFKETASQSYKINDLIYLDSNGTIAVCTTSTTNSVAQLTSAVLGLAETAATGTTGTAVKFNGITPNQTYIMNAYHPTEASAVFAQTDLGTLKNIGKSASGLWHVDVRNTLVYTLPQVRIVGFPKMGLDSDGNWVTNAAVADVYGLAYVQFVPFYEISGPHQACALQLWL